MEKIKSKSPLIIIAGPTASGKSELAVLLGKRIGGEIISADSMQIYKKMNIGTAKILPEEQMDVPHHLLDCLEPWEDFDITLFQSFSKEAILKIYQNGNIPIIAGGTGFYIQAVLNDISFSKDEDRTEYRTMLEEELNKKGISYLVEKLRMVDPESADKIHPNNKKRIIRALEYFYQTGEKISTHNAREKQRISPYNYLYFAITMDRSELYKRIEKRVDDMIEKGLLNEVETLLELGCDPVSVSMQGIGYKEIVEHLQGKISLEEAIYKIKIGTRHLAKRQMTLFRGRDDIIWIDQDQFENKEEIINFMLEKIRSNQVWQS